MTNPGDIVRVRARRGGRASIYEANAWCQGYTEGLLDGTGVVSNTVADLNVLVGGTPTRPDVVLAKNPAGYRIALDLVGQQVIALTTPAANKRISSIVAYTDDLALSTTQNDVTGSPESCGLIVVNGAASAEPVAPTDSEIRAAITADGAAGSQACYGVIANITVSSDTTTITKTLIDIAKATLSFKLTSDNVDWATIDYNEEQVIGTWLDGKLLYRKVIQYTIVSDGNWHDVVGADNIDSLISVSGYASITATEKFVIPYATNSTALWFSVDTSRHQLRQAGNSSAPTNKTAVLVLEYTKHAE